MVHLEWVVMGIQFGAIVFLLVDRNSVRERLLHLERGMGFKGEPNA